MKLILTSLSFCMIYSTCQSQTLKFKKDTLSTEPEIIPNNVITSDIVRELSHSSYEFGLSTIILIFGITVLILETYLIKMRKIDSDQAIRLFSVTLIIISSLFLITAAYSDTQMAPAMGLFGTLAGYLLGRSDTGKSTTLNDRTKDEDKV